MLPQVATLLCCLSIGIGTRFVRADTRDIPSTMFKPLNGPTQGNQNYTSSSDNSDLKLSEHTAGEAHAVTNPPIPNRRNPALDEDYYDQYQPSRPVFQNSPLLPIHNQFFRRSHTSSFDTNFDRGSSDFPSPRFNRPQFGSSGIPFGTSDLQYGPSVPSLSQSTPLVGSGFISPDPFGPSSSNNFYRSESYSYTSDGNGPPQVERNVFDSRLGHGMTSRHF
ncbi:hypothetical protein KR093_001072 [Drosophila rubida]|uniref:Uncharacterized protein n=1 Tax=Drosophila rubida TaxID=30044 RepID=A0AAD4PMR9_9MUSC|nr:hypothetical protein KR093_001072 [Drosophila rubida]